MGLMAADYGLQPASTALGRLKAYERTGLGGLWLFFFSQVTGIPICQAACPHGSEMFHGITQLGNGPDCLSALKYFYYRMG